MEAIALVACQRLTTDSSIVVLTARLLVGSATMYAPPHIRVQRLVFINQ
jgi:hypothetical protein